MKTVNKPKKRIKYGDKTLTLTPKRKAFIQAKLDNPTISNTDAVIKAGYNVKNRHSAEQVASDLMHSESVVMALQQHNELLESAIIGTVKDWKDSETPRKREIALNAAMFAFDHVHGKATTKMEMHSEVVKISINLTNNGQTEPGPEDTIIDLTELDNRP